ncbi:hypothetical protein ABKW28_01255 [Nocardioides sp. 31GB23]|uniref:SHOCT domain-containing protein n=1 Tax=Nocardioides sp. 31GB23 TaxID=3156065 RepID=UPI0032AF6D2A
MMDDGYYGMDAGGWIAMTIFWVGLVTLVVWALWRTFAGSLAPTSPPSGAGESPEDVVDRRFAAGEVDEETYRSMRAALHSTRTPHADPR